MAVFYQNSEYRIMGEKMQKKEIIGSACFSLVFILFSVVFLCYSTKAFFSDYKLIKSGVVVNGVIEAEEVQHQGNYNYHVIQVKYKDGDKEKIGSFKKRVDFFESWHLVPNVSYDKYSKGKQIVVFASDDAVLPIKYRKSVLVADIWHIVFSCLATALGCFVFVKSVIFKQNVFKNREER